MNLASVESVRSQLDALGRGAVPSDLLALVRSLVPIEGAFVETFFHQRMWEPEFVPLNLPRPLAHAILATRPAYEEQAALNAVIGAPIGRLVLDRVLTRDTWKSVEAYWAIFSNGLGFPSALRLSSFGRGQHQRTTYLALFNAPDAPVLSDDQVAILELLSPTLRSTLERLAMPLLQRDRILEQIIQEQSLGLVVLSVSGRVLEYNERAVLMLTDPARRRTAAGLSHIEQEMQNLRAIPLSAESGERVLRRAWASGEIKIAEHVLNADSYDLPEPVVMLVLREHREDPRAQFDDNVLRVLSPRRQEVAVLMASTGMSYADIASALKIKHGTVRSHVDKIFAQLGVGTRAEMAEKIRR
jgi:DNA-binding NarL/FixJ family response regulator